MSDDQQQNNEAKEPSIFDQGEGVDWLLAWLISLAEKGIGMGVTLSMGGTLVSGTLIGGRQYFENMAKAANNAAYNGISDKDVEDQLRKVVYDAYDGFKAIYPKSDDMAEGYVAQPVYIHLTNALVYMNDKPLNKNRVDFRAKLSSVDGFLLGTLSTS